MVLRVILIVYICQLVSFLETGGQDQFFNYTSPLAENFNVTADNLNIVFFIYLYKWDENGVKRKQEFL